MSERMAQILAGLSHQGLPAVMLVTCAGGALVWATRRKRLWVRIASTVLCGATVLLLLAAFFHLGCATTLADERQCLSSMKRIGMGLSIYASDNDDTFPPGDLWAELIRMDPKLGCRAADAPFSYGLNSALAGMNVASVDEPSKTVLVFEADARMLSFVGGPKDVARDRHGYRPNIVFADGFAKAVRFDIPQDMLWTPRAR